LTANADSSAEGTLRKVLGHRSFSRFLLARLVSSLAVQMQTVGVGIQVYALTHNPLDLGLVGLSQFLPFVLLVLFAGEAADRWDRKRITVACFIAELGCALALMFFTLSGVRSTVPVFAVMIVFGLSRAFRMPASQALMPNLVPVELFGQAVAINSSTWQVATIAGPALGGFVYAEGGPAIVFAGSALLIALAVALMLGVVSPKSAQGASPAGWATLVDGLRFVWHRKTVLGAISLDLFAVLFGGVTALLPAYALDVLHVGPVGLGWLRAAPGCGAALTATWLALRPIARHAGLAMFGGVVAFGLMTIVFGISTWLPLSFCALLLLGAADMVSVFVRHMLVQLETPDIMRGRVSAVSWMFIGASNELGEFESGITAAWWGLVPAVVVGGLATLAVAALWSGWFPQLRRMDRFHWN
jgi:MFS family permease